MSPYATHSNVSHSWKLIYKWTMSSQLSTLHIWATMSLPGRFTQSVKGALRKSNLISQYPCHYVIELSLKMFTTMTEALKYWFHITPIWIFFENWSLNSEAMIPGRFTHCARSVYVCLVSVTVEIWYIINNVLTFSQMTYPVDLLPLDS